MIRPALTSNLSSTALKLIFLVNPKSLTHHFSLSHRFSIRRSSPNADPSAAALSQRISLATAHHLLTNTSYRFRCTRFFSFCSDSLSNETLKLTSPPLLLNDCSCSINPFFNDLVRGDNRFLFLMVYSNKIFDLRRI